MIWSDILIWWYDPSFFSNNMIYWDMFTTHVVIRWFSSGNGGFVSDPGIQQNRPVRLGAGEIRRIKGFSISMGKVALGGWKINSEWLMSYWFPIDFLLISYWFPIDFHINSSIDQSWFPLEIFSFQSTLNGFFFHWFPVTGHENLMTGPRAHEMTWSGEISRRSSLWWRRVVELRCFRQSFFNELVVHNDPVDSEWLLE